MNSVLEIITRSAEYLKGREVPNARREAEELIADALGVRRLDLYLQFERPLEQDELQRCRHFLMRRGKREPLQYLAGSVEFGNIPLKVTPDVLIPRPETEILVEMIAQALENRLLEGKVLWDVCCGSGCIGAALAARFPELRVVLSDLSEGACAVAAANAPDLEVRCGDLLAPFSGETCDFFVCNPPYIREDEYPGLMPEVRDFEPKTALVAGPTGLEFYQRLARELPKVMAPRGHVWLELGRGQGEPVKKIFEAAGMPGGEVQPDWSGHDRFFSLEIHPNFPL